MQANLCIFLLICIYLTNVTEILSIVTICSSIYHCCKTFLFYSCGKQWLSKINRPTFLRVINASCSNNLRFQLLNTILLLLADVFVWGAPLGSSSPWLLRNSQSLSMRWLCHLQYVVATCPAMTNQQMREMRASLLQTGNDTSLMFMAHGPQLVMWLYLDLRGLRKFNCTWRE